MGLTTPPRLAPPSLFYLKIAITKSARAEARALQASHPGWERFPRIKFQQLEVCPYRRHTRASMMPRGLERQASGRRSSSSLFVEVAPVGSSNNLGPAADKLTTARDDANSQARRWLTGPTGRLMIRSTPRRKQCRDAVTLVVVGDGAGTSLLHQQPRLGAVQRLDLAHT